MMPTARLLWRTSIKEIMDSDMKKTSEGYPHNTAEEAERMMRKGAKVSETSIADNISMSEMGGITVIVHDTPLRKRTAYYCTMCCSDSCPHCIIAKADHEERELTASPKGPEYFIEYGITHFSEKMAERFVEIVHTEDVTESWYQDAFSKEAVERESAYCIAEDICAKILKNIWDVAAAIDYTERLISAAAASGHKEAVFDALFFFTELVTCRLSEVSAETFADIMLKNKSIWMLFFMPVFERSDRTYIVGRLKEARINTSVLEKMCPDLFGNE